MKQNELMKKVTEILENIYNEQRIDDRIMASSSAADEFNVVDKIRGLPPNGEEETEENTHYMDSVKNLATGKEVNND